MSIRNHIAAGVVVLGLSTVSALATLNAFITLKNGYMFDPDANKAWVPHGIAYQTWNRPLGVWQSWDQINYDLDEMVKMGANSIRVDFVWQQIESQGDNIFDWANYDYLVQQCEARNIRIFALIGYQWPPNWFPDSYYTMHPPAADSEGIMHTNRWQSDIIGYETPGARAQYAEWISNVCARYKSSKAIAGWIVGNESGYLGLWSGLLDGYDTNCEAAFRSWVNAKYTVAGTLTTNNAPNLAKNPGYETNGATWSVTGQLGIEDGFNASSAETGSYGAFVTNNAGDHYTFQDLATNVWAPSYGTTFVYRVRARKAGTLAGSVKLEIYHPWVATTNIDITASLTTNWQTFSLYYKPTAGWDQIMELRVHNAAGGSNLGQVQFDNAYFGVTNTTVSGSGAVAGIDGANGAWGTTFATINDIKFVDQYRAYGTEGAIWADMVQWREDSIAGFTALGAKAAKSADTNHLISYSTVGMQWGEEDWRYHAEDRGKITAACLATNAPIDFFSVNNYPWSILGHESQNGQWGISFTKKVAKVPVMYSETGFTSSETMWPGMNEARQGPLIRNALWESLEAGAIGTHVFSWMDRPYITDREKGFGILTADRRIKAAFWDSGNAFQLMEQAKINDLLMGSQDPKPDIGFIWTAAVDSQYNRYECEMQQVAGALERLGYEPNFVNLADLSSGAYTNFKVLVLPRNMRVDSVVPGTGKGVLKFLREDVITKGIHILATADLPGMQDEYGKPRADFTNEIAQLFGIDACNVGGYEVPARTGSFVLENMQRIKVTFTNALGALTNGYTATPAVWKYNDEIKVGDGTVWATMDSGRNKGFEDNNTNTVGWGKWGNVLVQNNWSWTYSGSNMVQMWGDSGIFQDWPVVPFGRYSVSTYLRSNSSDPMRNNAYAAIGIEWYAKDDSYLGISEAAHVTNATVGAGGAVDAPNLAKNPGFETNGAAWSVTGQLGIEDGFNASSAETGSYGAFVTNNAGDHYTFQDLATNVWAPSYGTTFVYRVRARKAGTLAGSVKLEIYHPWVATTNIDITASLTTNWQTFSLYYKPTAGWDQIMELRVHNAAGGSNLGQVQFDNVYFGVTNTTITTGDAWVKYTVDALAPSNSWKARRIIRCGPDNLLANGSLTGTNSAPDSWSMWNDGSHDPSTAVRAGTTGNSWAFWWDGGIFQDVTSGFAVGDTLKFGGYMLTPSDDRIKNGTKYGVIQVEFYNGGALISTASTTSTIAWASTNDVWLPFVGTAVVPAGANKARLVVRCNNYADGSGRFFADDVYMRNTSKGDGSVFVDNLSQNPALVVKNLGPAKSAIFLFSAGDQAPDGDGNGDMDTNPWKWRYDYIGAIVKSYFGVQPAVSASGTNAFLCLPEYRTTTNGATLWQVKNYMYDRFNTNPVGGAPLTFTIQSSLFNGKNIRAFEQGRMIATNSNGTISLTLQPDGHEMLLAYAPGTNRQEVVQLSAAPSVVHPGGDRVYQVKAQYDVLTTTGLALKVAFKESGDNGDGITNEIYSVQTNLVTGSGEAVFYMWIPPYTQNDPDYKSTPDGGKYEFAAWLEQTGGVQVAQAVPRPTRLEWGVRPTAGMPTNLTKGATVTAPFEWEELYEPLFWQNTPMARNDSFPSRIAVLRSSKTEAQFPGHFAKVNAVCDWLESLGYVSGNPLDLSFDNVTVSNLFLDNFNDGDYNGWTRDAGCANWIVQSNALRVSRIGNSDNFLVSGGGTYTNCIVSTDIRYNKQDNYFDDAELYIHYKDRGNYYRVGIRNFYAFWRLKYTVMSGTNIFSQGWLYDFPKTNRPVENTWYNLKVDSHGVTNDVYFNGVMVNTFYATNVPSGRIALGTRAQQLGNWEPQKGYYFIDDDEMTFYAPQGQPQDHGHPLNLDYGYLEGFFNTLVLPSVYVMSDLEVSNATIWAHYGLNSIIAFDGSTAMKNETGATALGRIEPLFGVGTTTKSVSNLTKTTIGGESHYVTLDYAPGAQVTAQGAAKAYTTLTTAHSLGTTASAVDSAPSILCNVLNDNPAAPVKTFCFNYGADTLGQLTNTASAKMLARRAFEWSRGNAFKVTIALRYDTHDGHPQDNFIVYSTNAWVLSGSGSNSITITLPNDGMMTGTNLYWVYTVSPWDAADPWASQQGTYGSDLDKAYVTVPGQGLQIIGCPTNGYGGRDWALWLAYNTAGQTNILSYGVKDRGSLQSEDNFNGGSISGWTIAANPNIAWNVTNGALRATVVSTGGYAYITRTGLGIGTTNLTFEYYTRFMNGAVNGGVTYRGVVLYVNPQLCGWQDLNPNFITNNTGMTTGGWHHVVVSVRDGMPNLRSDLVIDGKSIFVDEPIEISTYVTNTIGFLSPNAAGYVEWDNARVSDEQYSFVTQVVSGIYFPTSNVTPFLAFVPDYDPSMWEHEGSTLGGMYAWYAYLQGGGIHDERTTGISFAPRLMVENTNFPALLNPGQNVQMPIEWERLPQLPMTAKIILQDAWTGTNYMTNCVALTNISGNALIPIRIPDNIPSGAGYTWSAFIFPTNMATNATADQFVARLGSDDTFRYGRDGLPIKPESVVIVSPVVGGDYVTYRDLGIPAGCDIYTWQGGPATFDGNYAGANPPEGNKYFLTDCSSWAGWGVLVTTGAVDMTEYRDGFVRFWLKSLATTKIEVEQLGGVKATTYIPTTSNQWKEIFIPVSSLTGISLTQIKGLFEITSDTASTFYVDHVRWTKGIVNIYTDAGIPSNSTVTTTSGGGATFNQHYTDGAAPEGVESFFATSTTWAAWSVVMTNGTLDMSLYTNGYIAFWARTTNALNVSIEAPQGTVKTASIPSTTGAWKEITIPMSTFGGFDNSHVYAPFKIASTNAGAYLVDNVRWRKGTNSVPSEMKEVFYSDAGIPLGTDILVWWANQYWTHLYSTLYDGGLESSAAGLFPNSGYWAFSSGGDTASALCTPLSLQTGTEGLREQTGNATTSTWASTYQERIAYAGDIFHASGYLRQPAGQGWVAGSTASIRMSFLDYWHQALTNYVSAAKVTTASQGWTLCDIPDTTAPAATRYVRFEVLVQKPAATLGVSVADYDDGWLRQANSFSGSYTEDAINPEGTKCFRSYCVGWSGWGVFYTNSVTNLAQYANGYLKFWYRSSGYTKVEVMSAWAGVTNKAAYPATGYFGPTTNATGQIVWQQKVIPISAFTGVDLQHVKSPFMVTDPVYDNAFYVDYVRYTLTP